MAARKQPAAPRREEPDLGVWVIVLNVPHPMGSVEHLDGSGYFASERDAQHHIDNRRGWIGMGDRKHYHPVKVMPFKPAR